jgi:hypothetical protein
MRHIVVLIFCLLTVDVFSQSQEFPIYYLNSNEVEWDNIYIKTSNIESVNVEKKTKGGKIYIKTIQPVTFMTLDMILEKHSEIRDSTNQVVYIINSNLITDKSKIKVDDSFFIQLEIKRLEKLNYINERYRNLILVNIQLLNEKPEPIIRIRGSEISSVN